MNLDYAENYIYIADTNNNLIRKVDTGGAVVTSVCGASSSGYVEGFCAATARFNKPSGIVADTLVPNNYFYVADTGNHCVRRFGPINATSPGFTSAFVGS